MEIKGLIGGLSRGDGEVIIFDHRVGKEFMTDGVKFFFAIGIEGLGEFDFEKFAHANTGDGVEAEAVDGIFNGDTLWIEHGGFG